MRALFFRLSAALLLASVVPVMARAQTQTGPSEAVTGQPAGAPAEQFADAAGTPQPSGATSNASCELSPVFAALTSSLPNQGGNCLTVVTVDADTEDVSQVATVPEPPMTAPGAANGNATVPGQAASPRVPVAPDQPQIIGSDKLQQPPPTADSAALPAQGTLNAPVPVGGVVNGHAVASEAAGGQQQPMTVEEMRAHGYLGIPGPNSTSGTPPKP